MKTYIKAQGSTTVTITKDTRNRLVMWKIKCQAKNMDKAIQLLLRSAKQ